MTTDEAFFSLDDCRSTSDVQYLNKDQKREEAAVFERKKTREKKTPKVLVSLGMTARGLTKPKFIDLGAKINSVYYCEKVLPHYIKEMSRLYPEVGCIFHQDSAPSHVSAKTLKFMEDSNIAYIPPDTWLTNSPDAAPCDFFLWGYLKNRLKRHKASTIASLKKVLAAEIKKVPLEMVQRALKSWPGRVLKIYAAGGSQIERHN